MEELSEKSSVYRDDHRFAYSIDFVDFSWERDNTDFARMRQVCYVYTLEMHKINPEIHLKKWPDSTTKGNTHVEPM